MPDLDDPDYLDPRPCAGKNSNVCVAEGCHNESCLIRECDKPKTPHVHIEVFNFDERGGGSFCMWKHGVWRVDPYTQSLVIGRRLERTHIPLVTIAFWKVMEGPDWCREEPR